MATSRKWRKDDYPPCTICGKSVESMSRDQQDKHEDVCKLEEIEQKKQKKLI